jgi:glycerophosphoryl diester phosphodiesterase
MGRLTVLLALCWLLAALSLLGLPRNDAEPSNTVNWTTRSGEAPQVIAHRGASGRLPEHTEAAYRLALEQGADVLEPDLQMSADGQLIVRRDPYLSTSTDVSERAEFAERKAERGGREDWWVMDFTAAELRSLKARQVFADRPQDANDRFPMLTFTDFLAFVARQEQTCGCTIPVEPEVKLPALYGQAGLDPLPALLAALDVHGLNAPAAAVKIQSFDPSFLRRLRPQTPLPLLQLYSGPDDPSGNADGLDLAAIAEFADGIGANKAVLLNPDGPSTGFLERAHALGLDVHVWTVRDDRPPLVGDSVEDELVALYSLGVDAVFTDFPATAVAVREAMHDH